MPWTTATTAAAASRTTAPKASTWSVPNSGTSQNAVTNVPTMLPAVEIENSRPAVRPRRSIERAASRTAIGETEASTTLIGPKRTIAATSGSSRGPGSHETTCSRTHSSTSGIASTSTAPSAIAPTNRYGDGQRSASAAAGPVADREPCQDDADQRPPDVQRAAERRCEHAARGDLDAEQCRTREEHGGCERERVDPLPALHPAQG